MNVTAGFGIGPPPFGFGGTIGVAAGAGAVAEAAGVGIGVGTETGEGAPVGGAVGKGVAATGGFVGNGVGGCVGNPAPGGRAVVVGATDGAGISPEPTETLRAHRYWVLHRNFPFGQPPAPGWQLHPPIWTAPPIPSQSFLSAPRRSMIWAFASSALAVHFSFRTPW